MAELKIERGAVLDVLFIGAGLSGIDAAYRLQERCPGKTYRILESRSRIGGTWDLFRYPGIRSDSDIETLGFPFRPWAEKRSIVDGQSIQDYIEATALEFGIDKNILFGWKVLEANWNPAESLWEVKGTDSSGEAAVLKSHFLYGCTGYYSYNKGYQPTWPGFDKFQGEILHPQSWPKAFDAHQKKIVVIGSGATAITIVPELANNAKSVTMLQRSPSYVVARPTIDPLSAKIRALSPHSMAPGLVRFKNICVGVFQYQFAQRVPKTAKAAIMRFTRAELPETFDVNLHFNPRYNPWDQRVCVTPDSHFFRAIHSGAVNIETDEIYCFEAKGIRLQSGKLLEADAVVTATGLNIELIGGVKIFIDQKPVDLSKAMTYKGTFLSDIPNFAMAVGYTNASWTLKCDLSARYVCRLLNYMDRRKVKVACATTKNSAVRSARLLNLSSNYVRRSEAILPRQGDRRPWKLHQNYFLDWASFKFSRVNDGSMKFSK